MDNGEVPWLKKVETSVGKGGQLDWAREHESPQRLLLALF